jgi:hypothetical protein
MNNTTNIGGAANGNLDFVRYVLKTVLIPNGMLVNDGGAWRFRFESPITGLDVNRTYQSQDAAIVGLIQALHTQHTGQVSAA